MSGYIDVVFDGLPDAEPHGSLKSKAEQARSIRFGKWLQRLNGARILRTPSATDRMRVTSSPGRAA
jgi:hypothetical protein